MTISKTTVHFLIATNLLSSLIIIGFTFYTFSNKGHDPLIEAERINIVNEDGTVVMAISNKQRIAAPRVGGKAYPVEMIERQHFAGIIFFNEEGDEIGGLIYNSKELEDGRKFGAGHLSFDRHRDNQVINLEHKENIHGLVKSGLSIYDREGDGSFKRNLDLMHEYRYEDLSEARKKEIVSEIREMRKAGKLGSERLFLGSKNEIPQLSLKDKEGQERIKLFVDSLDVARILFFDEQGEIISEFPQTD
ncbi:MAG: hypothetical protein R8P61_35500 [Bacteroidia bacterium]|nr:hypothetical protein [Bacteroidia bacterium]